MDEDLQNKTRKELVNLCRERKIKGYSTKNKDQLISLLQENQSPKEINRIMDSVNTYVIGDNLSILETIKSNTIDLIYMDPPYNTGRNFYYFDDNIRDFQDFMERRIKECHRILKKEGNIIIHIEPRISHYIRIVCDKIFGIARFRNEIVWHTGGNAKNKYQLGRNHDVLIVYSKSAQSQFFPLYQPYNESYKKKMKLCPYRNVLYTTSAAHNSQPEVNPRVNLRYEWNGHHKQWYFSKERLQELHDSNRLEYNSSGIPRIKRYLDEMEGIPIRDTWDDISSLQSTEKLSYATQKPIKLIQRILLLYSKENDLCLDPFAGSGTLGRAAISLKRNYLLIDINPEGKNVFEKSLS